MPLRRSDLLMLAHPVLSSTHTMTRPIDVSLEVGIAILELLCDVTKDVPYLGTITGCIQSLIDVQKSMKHNKKRAEVLLSHISLFAMQPFEPSDGCLALRKLMANSSNG
ncbi:hypothetical protein C8J57DRAFT_1246916 [Mycena rebaudengoi]|nr:hypothetical protein C8J57DRAFT_1246916 [Mycena rebaudengoi]